MVTARSIAPPSPRSRPERFFDAVCAVIDLPRLLLCVMLLSLSPACLAVTTYAYDTYKRLVSVSYADGTQIRYGYDVSGNMVSRVIGNVNDPVKSLDVDASAPSSKYDALTDGVLYLRYLYGLTGPALVNNALGATATRRDPAAIKTYLDGFGLVADIDGDGTVDPSTDGLLVLRYLFGLRGASLIAGAVGAQATRKSAEAIEQYIETLLP